MDDCFPSDRLRVSIAATPIGKRNIEFAEARRRGRLGLEDGYSIRSRIEDIHFLERQERGGVWQSNMAGVGRL